jgi:uncharacterized protein (TIGR03083 family)
MSDDTAAAQTEPRITKAELLERISTERSALEATLARLRPDQMTSPGPNDDWSIKDHLAHIATWYRSLLALLEGRSRSEAVGISREEYEHGTEDSVNAVIDARNKARSLDDVLADLRATDQQVMAVIERLSDEDLYLPYSHYQPSDPPHNPAPVIGWIIGNTCDHVAEHHGYIQALVGA